MCLQMPSRRLYAWQTNFDGSLCIQVIRRIELTFRGFITVTKKL
jgi:hypothetical protein